jgi:hypothetical protein
MRDVCDSHVVWSNFAHVWCGLSVPLCVYNVHKDTEYEIAVTHQYTPGFVSNFCVSESQSMHV